jgi:hypothetical protein
MNNMQTRFEDSDIFNLDYMEHFGLNKATVKSARSIGVLFTIQFNELQSAEEFYGTLVASGVVDAFLSKSQCMINLKKSSKEQIIQSAQKAPDILHANRCSAIAETKTPQISENFFKPLNSVQPNINCEVTMGFYTMDQKPSFDDLKKKAQQADKNSNLAGLAQVMFEQFNLCSYAWGLYTFPEKKGKQYDAGWMNSGSQPSMAQEGLAGYFSDSLKNHAISLNNLLSSANNDFLDDFCSKFADKSVYQINSFFNLINYISHNMNQLNSGFNYTTTMDAICKKSAEQNDNSSNSYLTDKASKSQPGS